MLFICAFLKHNAMPGKRGCSTNAVEMNDLLYRKWQYVCEYMCVCYVLNMYMCVCMCVPACVCVYTCLMHVCVCVYVFPVGRLEGWPCALWPHSFSIIHSKLHGPWGPRPQPKFSRFISGRCGLLAPVGSSVSTWEPGRWEGP